MRLPADWEAHRTPGYGELHKLQHTPCGWTSPGYGIDLVLNESTGRRIIAEHRCSEVEGYEYEEDQDDVQPRLDDFSEHEIAEALADAQAWHEEEPSRAWSALTDKQREAWVDIVNKAREYLIGA